MAGARLNYNLANLRHIRDRIQRLGKAQQRGLLNVIGATNASQTQRRLLSEKEAPDGTPWPEWADATSSQRHANQSLLFFGGDLAQSIQHQIDASSVDIGSNLAYAATHQFGDQQVIQVPGHTRTIDQAFGKPIQSVTVTVKSHSVKRNIPAREYLGVSKSDAIEIETVVNRFLDRQVEENLKGLPS